MEIELALVKIAINRAAWVVVYWQLGVGLVVVRKDLMESTELAKMKPRLG